MREIKFRGVCKYDGEYVYGFYIKNPSGVEVIAPLDDPSGIWNTIEPGSARQLVGRDKNGTEIYEGDTVYMIYDGNEYDWAGHLTSCAIAEDGRWIGRFDHVEVKP